MSAAAAIALGLLALSSPSLSMEDLPPDLQGVTLEERLGQSAAIDARFTDHAGRETSLRDALADGKPVLLTLNYYRCGTLCNFQLNAMMVGLKMLNWTPGEEFRIVTVSIDPRETPSLAAEKRGSYLTEYGRGDVDWAFWTGSKSEIDALADSVGFRYRYIEEDGQYAHPATAVFLSPDGIITRYLSGLSYEARDLRFALMEAADGSVGTPVEQFVFSCYRYDTVGGRYTPFAFGLMRAAGSLTVLGLVFLVTFLFRQEKRRHQLMESTTP